MLAGDLSGPSPPWKYLSAAGGVGRTVEVPRQLDEVRSCERHADELVGSPRASIRSQLRGASLDRAEQSAFVRTCPQTRVTIANSGTGSIVGTRRVGLATIRQGGSRDRSPLSPPRRTGGTEGELDIATAPVLREHQSELVTQG